jgi:hypothetical protein
MSALQTFMLVADHDREEAKLIAEQTAKGEDPSLLLREYYLLTVL